MPLCPPLLSCLAHITSSAVTASTLAVAKVMRPRFASGDRQATLRLVRSNTSPATRDQTACAGFFWLKIATPAASSRRPYNCISPVRFSETPVILAIVLGASSSVSPSPTLNQPSPVARRFALPDGKPCCVPFWLFDLRGTD